VSTNPPAAPPVEIRGLHKAFGDLEVLKGIDTTIHKGEVVCVIGPSGSGKSTLLRCVNLLEQPTSGRSSSTASRSPIPTATSTTCARHRAWCSSSSTCSRT
jgi:ABC-type polar amino acid transport system ATPase subunit